MPFRKSIWEFDSRYAVPTELASTIDLQVIARLQSIEAAKKQVSPTPIALLAQVGAKLPHVPDPNTVTPEQFAQFVKGLLVHGIGIKTAVCMLAVHSEGRYPPMDNQVAAGLRALNIIDDREAAILNTSDVLEFSGVYVVKVLPKWRACRAQGISPRDLDERWAKAGD